MKLTFLSSTGLGLLIVPFCLFADTQSYYCPENHAYINLGMTPDQVIAACGQPLSQQASNQPVLQKVPVTQLIYNNIGNTNTTFGLGPQVWNLPANSSSAFYGVWNLSTGIAGGAQLEVDIANQKVRSIKLNGSGTNSASICQGGNIQPGDPVQKVYSACGSPSIVNSTYINELIPTSEKPKVWIYKPGEYQPSVTLTFINGRLQSIQ